MCKWATSHHHNSLVFCGRRVISSSSERFEALWLSDQQIKSGRQCKAVHTLKTLPVQTDLQYSSKSSVQKKRITKTHWQSATHLLFICVTTISHSNTCKAVVKAFPTLDCDSNPQLLKHLKPFIHSTNVDDTKIQWVSCTVESKCSHCRLNHRVFSGRFSICLDELLLYLSVSLYFLFFEWRRIINRANYIEKVPNKSRRVIRALWVQPYQQHLRSLYMERLD